ncbi:8865_t:CDS:2, partial [Cetraspora pellucida]
WIDEMTDVNISTFIPTIKSILRNSDPNEITARDIRTKLEEDFNVDLTDRKHEVQQLIEKCFDDLEIGEESASSDDFKTDIKVEKKKKKHYSDAKPHTSSKSKSSKSPKVKEKARPPKVTVKSEDTSDYSSLEDEYKPQRKKKRGRKPKSSQSTEFLSDDEYERKFEEELNGGVTGIHKPLVLSPVLSEFLHAEELSRLEVVKRLWAYIKENNLQDPNDKRFIVCDDNLKTIFKQDRIHSFTMNKYLTGHLKKKEDLVDGETLNVSSNGSDHVEQKVICKEQVIEAYM